MSYVRDHFDAAYIGSKKYTELYMDRFKSGHSSTFINEMVVRASDEYIILFLLFSFNPRLTNFIGIAGVFLSSFPCAFLKSVKLLETFKY